MGTCRINEKTVKFKFAKLGGVCFLNGLKTACAQNLNAKKLF